MMAEDMITIRYDLGKEEEEEEDDEADIENDHSEIWEYDEEESNVNSSLTMETPKNESKNDVDDKMVDDDDTTNELHHDDDIENNQGDNNSDDDDDDDTQTQTQTLPIIIAHEYSPEFIIRNDDNDEIENQEEKSCVFFVLLAIAKLKNIIMGGICMLFLVGPSVVSGLVTQRWDNYGLVIIGIFPCLPIICFPTICGSFLRWVLPPQQYWMLRIAHRASDLQYVPNEFINKELVLMSLNKDGTTLQYAPVTFQGSKESVLIAVKKDPDAIQFASTPLRNDKEIALIAVNQNPDAIKYIHRDLKRDPDILIAAGLFDIGHDNAVTRQQQQQQRRQGNEGLKKIVLSTRFALDNTSWSEATNFTALFKNSEYVKKDVSNIVVYSPNAFDKKSCDSEWTRFDWPCRGTADTCRYNNVLTTTGHPTDDCCWRYSFRSQLQEAKDTGGYMIQLVESGDVIKRVKKATLGCGQRIELDMAESVGCKVFHVYLPSTHVYEKKHNTSRNRYFEKYEEPFSSRHIDDVTAKIS